MQLIDKLVDFGQAAGENYVRSTQEIPDDYISQLKRDKINSDHNATGELHRVASVPTIVADLWLKQGFDIYREDADAIVKRLQREGLDAFITSNKV